MDDPSHVNHQIRGKRGSDALDRLIAGLAERQHGVVCRRQLTSLGVDRRAIDRRLECGRLHCLHRGVYAVGHRAISREGKWMAAVLAGGPGALLSHRSAAALWGIRVTARAHIEVTVSRSRRARHGIDFHKSPVAADEATIRSAIPVTTAPRTLLDLAATINRSDLERVMERAEALRLVDPLSLADLTARHPRRPGVTAIRKALGTAIAAPTRSELEDRFLAVIDKAGLPRPSVNVPMQIAGRWVEVDCLWADRRLAVELDGHSTHGTRAAFERDRARDRALNVAGWRVVRITWSQLRDHPRELAADIEALLRAERSPTARPRPVTLRSA
jgi:predicted transcriptional regulator of viral defense system